MRQLRNTKRIDSYLSQTFGVRLKAVEVLVDKVVANWHHGCGELELMRQAYYSDVVLLVKFVSPICRMQ